jgi:DNA-binding NarL/FixJ family response regulator
LNVTTVLIADDEPLFAEAVELILQSDERIDVVGKAHDGRRALELARELEPDVILMDLNMPGMDGFQAIENLVREEPSRKVVVLSGSNDPEDMARAQRAGARAYLTKERIADDLVPRVLAAATE